jgi:HK97 family phage major capsid protein
MYLTKSRELREKRKKLVTDAQALIRKDGVTKEDRDNFDRIMADADALLTDIERHERADRVEEEFRGAGAPPAGQPAGGADDPEAIKERTDRERRAFNRLLRFGNTMLTQEDRQHVRFIAQANLSEWFTEKERRDMGTSGQGAYPGITSGGGVFVPVGFVNRVEEALKWYGPMLDGGADMPEIMPTSTGQPLPFPTDNDTAQVGEQIDENAPVSTQDVSLSQILFGAYKFSTKMVKVSLELLQDSAFDIEAFLIRKFAQRTGRILNTKFTTGAGTTTPMGIVTAATLGSTAVGSATNDGGAVAANTIGSDDLVDLEHTLDPLYRPGARYMFHDGTLAALKKVKDKFGRPIWMPSIIVKEPDRINGYLYAVNNDMDQLQTQVGSPPATRKTVLFGQMNKYVIRRVKDMTVLRLTERFADYGQVAFIGFSRYDGNLIDAGTHPVKYMKNVY